MFDSVTVTRSHIESGKLHGLGVNRIERLNAELRQVLNLPEVKAQLDAQGITVVGDGPSKFQQQIAREHVQWARTVKAA